MSRDASIELDWADGHYIFRLAWGELRQLQEKCDAGPFVILSRLRGGTWRMDDISEVVRLGLIGGGATPADALKLVRDYVESRPPLENLMLATGILSAGVIPPADEPGEAEAAQTSETV